VKRKHVIIAGLVGLALTVAALAGTASASSSRSSKASLHGAGSTWLFPLISLWAGSYHRASINYDSIGSGGGIAAISNRQVDFGTSDAPLTKDQFAACHSCVQIPWALGGTSVPYNVKGAPDGLKMSGPVLAKIYLGQITKWNSPAIRKLNKGVSLPNEKIVPLHRSDGSGTTYNFTDYLSRVSKAFKSRVGKGIQVNFPGGVGAKGSSGVAGALSNTEGAIGYMDVAYSLKNGFSYLRMKNKAGNYTFPSVKAVKAASKSVKRVPKSNAISIVNPPKKYRRAYPISTFSWVIVPRKSPKAAALKAFIGWAVTKGQHITGVSKRQYVPIPKIVQAAALRTLKKIHA
jgi:phosphate transport system substrate-binding protein